MFSLHFYKKIVSLPNVEKYVSSITTLDREDVLVVVSPYITNNLLLFSNILKLLFGNYYTALIIFECERIRKVI